MNNFGWSAFSADYLYIHTYIYIYMYRYRLSVFDQLVKFHYRRLVNKHLEHLYVAHQQIHLN